MAWLVKENVFVQAWRFFQNLQGPQVFTCAGKECARTCSSKDLKELGSNVSALCALSCLFFWLCFFLPPLLGEELAEELDDDEPDDDELPEEPSGGLPEDRDADPVAFGPEASAVEASPAFDADGSVSVTTSASETGASEEGGAWSEEAATQESAADSATSGDETSTAGELAPAASEDTSTSFDSSSNDASEDTAASSESDRTIGRPASPDAEGSALEAPAFRMVVDFSPA